MYKDWFTGTYFLLRIADRNVIPYFKVLSIKWEMNYSETDSFFSYRMENLSVAGS